ncbi:cysteine hydrolase family protein [Alicyclobacillus sp. ALC3]|uniref:cysteine hydrolase family protein n=1 Tax=Alicyclobacillus sp. ALC3 TaxID=2796143 RepID=UPI002378D11A|nr:cysteine hydrolase family protein [Alicyclobacillus sp. ALC3]WDL97186.1 cysteine hydrolase [Alicyclobacillus sp. ALC3]
MTHDSALLVIDVQVGMFLENNPVHSGDLLLERIGGLITMARASGAPVFYVQHNAGAGKTLEPNTFGWNIHPEIAPIDGDIIIQKSTPDAFHETNLQEELGAKRVRRLVIAGIQTELCVDTTSRRAFSLGYDVVVVSDAHSTWDRGNLKAREIIAHHNDLLRWFAETEEASTVTF